MTRPRIPLEIVRIDSPCPASWEAMAGDDRRRFCEGCLKYVHDLSAMPREEAERLICESSGTLCVRMSRQTDGTVLTVDYQGSTRQRPKRGWRFWTAAGLIGAFFAGIVQAMTGKNPTPVSVKNTAGTVLPPVRVTESSMRMRMLTTPTQLTVTMGVACPPPPVNGPAGPVPSRPTPATQSVGP
jgi:hypothetical protein